ncbi:hypothetical protein NQZ68_029798 [Dissostichus eleginoides]|nr:hypothetical protein NQZ68_029798 [Dissostichus eleginoides]
MGFLTPFIIDRETSSNVPRQTLPPSNLVPEEESQECQLESQPADSQPADSQQAQAGETGQELAIVEGRDRGKRRRGREMSPFEKGLMSAVSPLLMPAPRPPPPPPVVVLVEDEDELFFRSLLPSMRRLSISKRARVRFQIHKAIFEAEQEMEEN